MPRLPFQPQTNALKDRIGVGASAHPDPIQVVQFPLHVATLHRLVELAHNGRLGCFRAAKVVLVGHSYGSQVVAADLAQHPADADGVIVTAVGTNMSLGLAVIGSESLSIARENDPGHFGSLPDGYWVYGTPVAVQFSNFKYPYFDESGQ